MSDIIFSMVYVYAYFFNFLYCYENNSIFERKRVFLKANLKWPVLCCAVCLILGLLMSCSPGNVDRRDDDDDVTKIGITTESNADDDVTEPDSTTDDNDNDEPTPNSEYTLSLDTVHVILSELGYEGSVVDVMSALSGRSAGENGINNAVIKNGQVCVCLKDGVNALCGSLANDYDASAHEGEEVKIGPDGNWTVGGEDTGKHAYGRKDGDNDGRDDVDGSLILSPEKIEKISDLCDKKGFIVTLSDGSTVNSSAEVPAKHAIILHEGKAATCTENGWNSYEICEKCDYTTYSEIAASHDIINHKGRVATCTEAGWNSYETCSNCDYTTYEEIAATGHAVITHTAKAATCTEIGWDAYETCSNCDYTTYEEIAATGHAIITHTAKAPACTEIGWEAYETCLNCDYTTYEEIAATNHTIITHAAKEPTCTEIGWEAYGACLNCDFNTYVELPAKDHTMVGGVCKDCGYGNLKNIVLTSNVTSVLINGSEYHKITLYAQIFGDVDISSVNLYGAGQTYYGTMNDDGAYSTNGDELSNDNVYTLKVSLYITEEGSYSFVASTEGTDALTSNEVTVEFINNISSEELDKMEEVDETIDSEIFEQDSFENLEKEEKKQIVEDQLTQLEEQQLIVSGSVIYNEDTSSFTFQYESGALGAIVMEEIGKDTAIDLELDLSDIASNTKGSAIDAIVLWSFDQLWDDPSFRTSFYEDAVAEWVNDGIDAFVDWNVTIEDYKKLSEYEIIILSAHGSYYEYKTGHVYTEKLPSIILTERATREKDELYAEDLKMHRIGKISVLGGTMYTILPDFWTYYYGAGALDGSFVFSESCEFAGAYNDVDDKMFDAILDSSAESVIGFHNSVAADYSRNLMKYYVSALIAGYTAEEAFEMAKAEYGANDYFPGRELFGPTAYPIMNGNKASSLISSDLENGSFEDKVDLSGWEYEGDVRVLTQLGALSPRDEDKMAILTTGIGSGESGYLGATEGSVLYQTFYVGANNTTLSFMYNVVSEEPHEFIGSSFDDRFYAEIVTENGNKYIIASESVNASTWYKVQGIDFDSGDHTAYETGWKFTEYDLSAFSGQFVTVRFVTYDVGDSRYDTAALIDSVTLN